MKLVKENINFEKDLDPKTALGIGLKPELEKIIQRLREMWDEGYETEQHGLQEYSEELQAMIRNLPIMKK